MGPQIFEREAIGRKQPSAQQGRAEGHLGRTVGRPGPRRHPSLSIFVSLQSPPKLNEVSSDANRENSAAESGSESSSQEATPEKGTWLSCSLLGGAFK